jgi:hypothetical protein
MYKELKETHKNNSMRILQKKKIKETETTKWTHRGFQQTLERHQGNYKKKGKWNKEGNTSCERGT